MTKAFLSLGLAAISLLAGACRREGPPPAAPGATGPYAVGILQSVDSPTANELRRGILQAFAEAGLRDGQEIVVTIRIANNDIAEVQRMARELAAGQADLIIPLSTQALQAAILASSRLPIVFGAVAVPYLVGAGRSADDHLRNVTGVVSTGPIGQTIALIREVLPGARRVGSLWTPSEVNSEYYLDLAREAASQHGLELVTVPVSGPFEVQASLQRLLNLKVDALFPMSDNTLNSSFDVVGRAAWESGVPLFASFLRSVEFGACAALGYDFFEMGLRTGRLAVRVKKGERPGQIPIQSMGEVMLYVNPEAAARQGVVLPPAVLARAARLAAVTFGAAAEPGLAPDRTRRPTAHRRRARPIG
ncbi:MAG: ABC transporter substrate-binding protein [Candidatus Aminicenantes bacterium]|nr:ABC transporter substrate-binding protein [Candidatus Aminicenantes bacterium]